MREILHAYYARTDHSSFALKEEIEDDVKYEFSQQQHIWDASWTLLSKVLMEEFPDIIYKRKRRYIIVFMKVIFTCLIENFSPNPFIFIVYI